MRLNQVSVNDVMWLLERNMDAFFLFVFLARQDHSFGTNFIFYFFALDHVTITFLPIIPPNVWSFNKKASQSSELCYFVCLLWGFFGFSLAVFNIKDCSRCHIYGEGVPHAVHNNQSLVTSVTLLLACSNFHVFFRSSGWTSSTSFCRCSNLVCLHLSAQGCIEREWRL